MRPRLGAWPPKPRAKETAAVFAVTLGLTLISAWPLLRHLGSALPSDLGDPILDAWIFWWNARVLPLTATWWNAPMFAPLTGTIALSESLLAFAPLSTPLQVIGFSPIATHNIVYLLSWPAAATGAFVLARRLTGRADAAAIAALAFAFSPYRIGQLPHLQILWACWMPLALAALHRYLDAATNRARVIALVAFGVCWMLNGFTNGYVLAYFPVLVFLWLVWFARRWRDWLSVGAAALVGTLPILPMLLGYATRQRAFGFSRQISEVRAFSADLFSIFAASSRALASHWTLRPGPEGELYPGLAIVGLIIAGLIIAVRRNRDAGRWTAGRWTVIALALLAGAAAGMVMFTGGSELHLGPFAMSVHRPSRLLTIAFWLAAGAVLSSPIVTSAWKSRSPFAFYTLAAAAMYLLALGPEPHAGATQILYKPPYAWLMYLPGFDSLRVPARFGLLMVLCLAQAGALAFAKMTSGVVFGKRHPASFFWAAAILAEGWIVLPVVALPARLPVPARALAAGAVVMELPIETGYAPNTLALLHAIDHHRPIINGFSGYLPQHYEALGLALANGDPTALDAIREIGPIAAFVDAARDKNGDEASLIAAAPRAELLEKNDRGVWSLLPALPPRPEPVSRGEMLTISAVDATSRPDDAQPEQLIDGKPNTRWHGQIHGETAPDTVRLTLSRPATIDVVEIDQGLWVGSFARDLEIVLVTDAGDVSVFRGPTGGLAVRGALKSADVAMRIPIPPAPPARAVMLISHPRGDKWTWSVAEVRLYGK